MRKAQKQQLEEMVMQMEEAHSQIKKYIGEGSIPFAMELLEDCQNGGIAMGTLIEGTEGEGHPAVTLLEEYCELVYRIYENLAGDKGEETGRKVNRIVNENKIYKLLRQKLMKVENCVRNNIPVRTEAVFLPYKASMWDSLESVWKAADADENCDAYVIPIPYYDRKPDGTFGEMHYEGDQYPEYVPVTRYGEFDLEAEHPDVIYIHNPYDECNFVTSVHPHFYAKNLRNYTDKLIYIPYFVLKEIEPDNQAAIEGMKHFCFTPGTVYANQVVVQSENMRQIYINEYIKAAKKAGLSREHTDRKFVEKKFLGTGSPKIDKVLNTRKEDLEIPQEWLKVIEKPDGSWKKIVFYNTSISALLLHSEKMLEKMESVFGIFKKNQDKIAFLWRPHPLIKATVESMRPTLWRKYKEIKDRYIEEGWGIYDDTSDVDRAVVLSDAYYGDESSVVELCKKSGTFVMIQNANATGEIASKKDMRVSIEDAIIYEERAWFITNAFNGLFSMNLKTGEIEYAGQFPGEAYETMRLYETMKLVGGKIYFVPFNAKTIAVFDINKEEFNNIILDEIRLDCKSYKPLFGGIEAYGEYLYIIPVYSKAIIRLNTKCDEVEYITGWASDAERLVFNDDAYFRKQVVLAGKKMLLPFCNANAVMELDCETLKYYIYQLGIDKMGYSGICYDGINYWLSSRTSGDLVQWNPKENNVRPIRLEQNEITKSPNGYLGVLYSAEGITLFSALGGREYHTEALGVGIVVMEGRFTFVKQEGFVSAYYRSDLGKLVVNDEEKGKKVEIEIKVNSTNVNAKYLLSMNEKSTIEGMPLNIGELIKVLRNE